jgi:hypothetical protein
MGAPPVVVPGVPVKDVPQVLGAEDEHPVGDLVADGEHEPFRVRVGPRTLWWDLAGGDVGVGEHRVERGGELPGPVPDQSVNWLARSPRSMSRFLACWVVHAPSGLVLTPRMCM